MRYYDNTRIEAYRTCPRKYFFRHERDWSSERKSLPLINGSAWHDAMDFLWSNADSPLTDMELTKASLAVYIDTWCEEGMPHPKVMTMEQQDQFAPRGPHIAVETLMNYIQARRRFIREGEVLAVERPFAVPVYDDPKAEIMYIGRLDKVFRSNSEGTIIVDHKSTTEYYKSSGLKQSYIESWSPNSQVDGYAHAGNILYDNLKGIWMDIAVFNKTVHNQFKFIPISRQFAMLDSWLEETLTWIERIEHDRKLFKETGRLGRAFPKNTSRCGDYGGCTYRDVCKFYTRPEDIEIPPGFIADRWDPFDVLKVEKLGLKPEGDRNEA